MNGIILRAIFYYLVSPKKLSQKDILDFNKELISEKKALYKNIYPYLKKGNFQFGNDLYKYSKINISKDGKKALVYIYIIFEDDEEIGRDLLLKKIKKTGLLNRSDITIFKSYGKIY